MPKFTILHTMSNTPSGAEWEAHKAGCRDVARTTAKYAYTVENLGDHTADNAEALVASWLGDPGDEGEPANLGWTPDDFRVLPCAAKAV